MITELPGRSTPLSHALERLVDEGQLTREQAVRVTTAVAEEEQLRALQAGSTATAVPPAGSRSGRLAEVAGYAGGALVLAGGALVLGQNWEQLSRASRLLVVGLLTALLAAAGVAIVRSAPGGRTATGRDAQPARRRLAGVLLVLAAAGLAGFVGLITEDTAAGLPIALAGLAGAVGAHLLAPTAVSEIALLGGTLGVTGTALANLPERMAEPQSVAPVIFAVGVAWAVGVSRVLREKTLALSLGLLVALGAGPSGDRDTRTVGLVLLALLAAGAFTPHVRRPPCWVG